MTTDEKAREIVETWWVQSRVDTRNQVRKEDAMRLDAAIATALLAARREGIEEAAKVVELYAFPAKQTIAAAIRALP